MDRVSRPTRSVQCVARNEGTTTTTTVTATSTGDDSNDNYQLLSLFDINGYWRLH